MWLPLSWALNMVNRSMGRDDLYPFVLPAAVLEKMLAHGTDRVNVEGRGQITVQAMLLATSQDSVTGDR